MFIKRLGFFLVGLSIGIVFLAFFLKKKSDQTGVSFCYFPNCRVLKDMRSKPLYYDDAVAEMLKNKEIDTLVINSFFTNGEVNFGDSDTKSTPCKTYFIEQEIAEKLVTLKVKNCSERVTVVDYK